MWLPCFAPFLKWPLSLPGINTAGEHAPEAEVVPITTWQGPVEVTRSARIPVSAFAEQLLSEPEHGPESMPSALISSARAHTLCGKAQMPASCSLTCYPMSAVDHAEYQFLIAEKQGKQLFFFPQ